MPIGVEVHRSPKKREHSRWAVLASVQRMRQISGDAEIGLQLGRVVRPADATVEMGALPQLYAATMPGLPPGSYLGPDGPMEQRGYPKVVGRSAAAQDEATAAWLWDRTEDLVGIRFSDVVASLPSA